MAQCTQPRLLDRGFGSFGHCVYGAVDGASHKKHQASSGTSEQPCSCHISLQRNQPEHKASLDLPHVAPSIVSSGNTDANGECFVIAYGE